MDGTLVDTEPYWIDTEFEIAQRYGGTWSRAHALNLVGNDLLESGRYIREHMGIEPSRRADRRGAARRCRRPGRGVRPVAAGRGGAAGAAVGGGYAVRAGHDVLPAVRGADPGPAPAGDLPGDRHRRQRGVRQAAPRALPDRGRRARRRRRATASRSRTPTPAPGRPRAPAAWCWSSRTTCRCSPAERRVFADTLVGSLTEIWATAPLVRPVGDAVWSPTGNRAPIAVGDQTARWPVARRPHELRQRLRLLRERRGSAAPGRADGLVRAPGAGRPGFGRQSPVSSAARIACQTASTLRSVASRSRSSGT